CVPFMEVQEGVRCARTKDRILQLLQYGRPSFLLETIARRTASRPGLTVSLSLLFCLVFCSGFANMKVETDGLYLWTDQDSKLRRDYDYAGAKYPSNTGFIDILLMAVDEAETSTGCCQQRCSPRPSCSSRNR
ncbi:unnamed protein product, partial [Polarella glacialis]